MSNAKQETISDIVYEMRDGVIANGWMEQTLREFADRIEAAEKQSVTNCNRFGNPAKMREALEQADVLISIATFEEGVKMDEVDKIRSKINAALSAPPRNCDIMDWRTAWAKWRTEIHTQKPCCYAEVYRGTEQFMDWYMSESKARK